MPCCDFGPDPKTVEGDKTVKGGENDLTDGPVKNRGCRDIPCIGIYGASWFVFVTVTMAGFDTGNVEKLYRPRDWQGNFCSFSDNWNTGVDLSGMEKLAYFMNLTTVLETAVKTTVCAPASQTQLTALKNNGAMSQVEYDNFMEACCLVPTTECDGSLEIYQGTDPAALASEINNMMVALTDYADTASTLFESDGPNGDMFKDAFEAANKYFVKSCTTSCALSTDDMTRSYTYEPAGDNKLKYAFNLLKTDATVDSTLQDAIQNSFTFTAMSEATCPYDPFYCVPMPGVEFKDIDGSQGYCSFELSESAVNAVSSATAEVYQQLGFGDITSGVGSSLGDMFGDVQKNIGVVILVMVIAFVIGLVFLVLMRFFVGCMVWSGLGLMFALLVLGGFALWVSSFQCADASLLEAGQSTLDSMVSAGTAAADEAMQSATDSSYVAPDEDMTGNGEDYTGGQTKTKRGFTCVDWDNTPLTNGGDENYCRNPNGQAQTIWCYYDVSVTPEKWDECVPLYTIVGECPEGYATESETGRKLLEIASYIVFAMAAIWFCCVFCMCKQIRLAVGVNKVAAEFIYMHPWIILQPILQITVAIAWSLLWLWSVSFLVSQVPDDYVTGAAIANYTDAEGTSDMAGLCNGNSPQGGVYKDELASTCTWSATAAANGESIAECWKCSQPRHFISITNGQFWFSLFHFLWNYALIIAIGQTVVAGAVGVWFFTKTEDKWGAACIRPAVYNVFRYHFGSLLFGSAILAIVQTARYFMKALEKQAEAQHNKIMECVFKIVGCCIWCFEKCIQFLNKNAYIQIALMGKSFCHSAKTAFFLILRNAARFAWVAMLGNLTQLIGVGFIATATPVVGFFVWKALVPSSPVLAVTIFVFFGYIVGKLYMSVFALCVDTCLQCFIHAEEMGDVGDFVPSALKDQIGHGEPKDS